MAFSSIVAFVVLLLLLPVTSHPTTSPARLPHIQATAYPDIGHGVDPVYGRLPGHQVFRRGQNCDANGFFFCPTGTCFTGTRTYADGLYVGCCTVSSCAARLSCYQYGDPYAPDPCDINTGGCISCSNPQNPYCAWLYDTFANPNQWAMYCNSVTTDASYQTSGGDATPSFVAASVTATNDTEAITTWYTSLGPETMGLGTSGSAPLPTASGSPSRIAASSTQSSSTSPATPNVSAAGTVGPQQRRKGGKERVGVLAGVISGVGVVIVLFGIGMWYVRQKQSGFQSPAPDPKDSHVADEKKDANLAEEPLPYDEDGVAEAGNSKPRLADAPTFATPELDGGGWGCRQEKKGYRGSRYMTTNPDLVELDHESCAMASTPEKVETADMEPTSVSFPTVELAVGQPVNHSTLSTTEKFTPTTPATKPPTPYTPSHYADEPPPSIPRTNRQAPPSLPQDYSLPNLGSMAEMYRGPGHRLGTLGENTSTENMPTTIYRGLRRSRGEGAPWEYLSAESAFDGGWKNDDDG